MPIDDPYMSALETIAARFQQVRDATRTLGLDNQVGRIQRGRLSTPVDRL